MAGSSLLGPLSRQRKSYTLPVVTTVNTWTNFSWRFTGITPSYMTLTASEYLNFGYDDFTWEVWVYFTRTGEHRIFDFGGGQNPLIYTDPSSFLQYYTSGAARIADSVAITTNTWYHIALVRKDRISTMYKNGVAVGSPYSDLVSFSGQATRIGANSTAAYFMQGYMSNVRITTGTALYNSTFTPATELYPSIQRVPDNGSSVFMTFSSNVAGCITCSRNGLITTGEFTLETWVYLVNNTRASSIGGYTGRRSIISNYRWQSGSTGGWNLFTTDSDSKLQLEVATTTENVFPAILTSTNILSREVWHHIAISRDDSDTMRMFIDGELAATPITYADSLNNYSTGGTPADAGTILGKIIVDGFTQRDPLNGRISSTRIVAGLGTCLYTSTFTVSTVPMTAIVGTQLMLTITTSTIYDAAPTSSTVTLIIGDAGSTFIAKYNSPFGVNTGLLTLQSSSTATDQSGNSLLISNLGVERTTITNVTNTIRPYSISTYRENGYWSTTTDTVVDILAVGAGGGAISNPDGTVNYGGGGGGGGVVYVYNGLLSSGTYQIVVGRGEFGQNGGNTYLINSSGTAMITALGGGVGASAPLTGSTYRPIATTATSGGSGGGASNYVVGFAGSFGGNGLQPLVVQQVRGYSNYGTPGGQGVPGGGYMTGGGGAGTTSGLNRTGGTGIAFDTTGTIAYYGGGGGGGGTSHGAGGLGGGGPAGGSSAPGSGDPQRTLSNGVNGTGGGGGGGLTNSVNIRDKLGLSVNSTSTRGGNGIFVIRQRIG